MHEYMSEFQRILHIKNAVQWKMFDIPGVHAVGIGVKTKGGQSTSELAIIISVIQKKPIAQLAEQERIPSEIDGVKTDIVESEIPRFTAVPAPPKDTAQYDLLIGGILIGFASGNKWEGGTLGCIGRTDEPEPKIVALTCHHVVSSFNLPQPTPLTAVPDLGPPATITIGGNNSGGLLIRIGIAQQASGNQGPVPISNFLYQPGDTEGPITMAINIALNINAYLKPNIQADADPTGVITLKTGPGVSLGEIFSSTFGKHPGDPRATLHAAAGIILLTPTITLTGIASSEGFASVNVNYGGPNTASAGATFGIFVPFKNGDTANTVAQSIAAGITHYPGLIGGVSASANNGQVTINGVQAVECDIFSDTRVGQPTPDFPPPCFKCTDRSMGRVIAARIDLDAALVQLNPGTKYVGAIQGIGVLAGTHIIRLEEVFANGTDGALVNPPFAVSARGAATAVKRDGIVTKLNVSGLATQDDGGNPPARDFYRIYNNAIEITSTDNNPFSAEGDSGSAVVASLPDPDDHNVMKNYVVGILFGQGTSSTNQGVTTSLATPIDLIRDALEFTVETSTDLNDVKTVPTASTQAHRKSSPSGLTTSLARAQQDIDETPGGKHFSELLRQHLPEAMTLVSKNRRVATVWHRNGGPKIINGVLSMTQSPENRLPTEIDGRPLGECIARIQHMLSAHGSSELAAGLNELGPPLVRMAGLNYSQALDTLRNLEID
jgi:hypothetical protein